MTTKPSPIPSNTVARWLGRGGYALFLSARGQLRQRHGWNGIPKVVRIKCTLEQAGLIAGELGYRRIGYRQPNLCRCGKAIRVRGQSPDQQICHECRKREERKRNPPKREPFHFTQENTSKENLTWRQTLVDAEAERVQAELARLKEDEERLRAGI